MDVRAYNRQAWDRKVSERDRWTVPVDTAVVQAARRGEWKVVLTPILPVPREWLLRFTTTMQPQLASLDATKLSTLVWCLSKRGFQVIHSRVFPHSHLNPCPQSTHPQTPASR